MRTTGLSEPVNSLFKQGGQMLSWQGLLLMFMFGGLITMAFITLWFMYSELKLERANKKLRLEHEEAVMRAIDKILLEKEEDDDGPL